MWFQSAGIRSIFPSLAPPRPAAPRRFLGLPLPAPTRPVKKKASPSIVGLHPYRLFTFGLSPFGLHPIGLPMTFGLSPDYKYVWTIPIGLTKTFGLHPKETTITFANKSLFWNTLKIRFFANPTHVLLPAGLSLRWASDATTVPRRSCKSKEPHASC